MGGASGYPIGDLPVIVSCDSVQARADSLNGAFGTTHQAIESSGVGAKDRAWLSGWEAFIAKWTLYYGGVGNCSALFPFGSNEAPATIQGELNSWADQLRQWQSQAIAHGIAIPGGVLPSEAGADSSLLSTALWVGLGILALGVGAYALHELGAFRGVAGGA